MPAVYVQWSKPQLTGVFSTNFPNSWPQPWKQDGKVFIDHQRAQEHLEGFRFTQRGDTIAQLRGPMQGGARGAAPGRLFPVWQLAWLHGRSLTRPGDRNVPLAVPRMGGTQPPSAPQEWGISYCSGVSFQQPGTPTPAKESPQDAFICSFAQDVHAQRQL